MSAPIALGRNTLPPSPPLERPARGGKMPIDFGSGGNILSAPTTPEHRMPVVDRAHADPQVVKAAEGMEAMFLDYMMKVMRETVPQNDMDLESPATGIYRSMMDTETAQRAAHAGGVGLAEQIIAYLDSQRYNQDHRGQAVPGGDHEGQPDRK